MTGSSTVAPPVPLLGRRWEHRQAAVAGLGSLTAGLVYVAAARAFAPDLAPGLLEFCGTVTSLWSVWITQRRNVLALPIGIVSVALIGAFFLQIGLGGQVVLHWAYYLPVQAWAWRHWARGGADGGELVVGRLGWPARATCVAVIVGGTALGGWLLNAGWDRALYTYWDASIVAASVVAMVLLSTKRVESWWLWIAPVNVSAIGLYAVTGATMFAALYALFLVMAVVGLVRWQRAADASTP